MTAMVHGESGRPGSDLVRLDLTRSDPAGLGLARPDLARSGVAQSGPAEEVASETFTPAESVLRVPSVRNASWVETVIEYEYGRWAVDAVVVFADGVTRHRIDTYPTEPRAEISARLIKRAAERELRGQFDV